MSKNLVPLDLVGSLNWSPQFGEVLKQIREERGFSRLALRDRIKASGFEISPQNIQKIEDGGLKRKDGLQPLKTVSLETLKAILKALDYPLCQFFRQALNAA